MNHTVKSWTNNIAVWFATSIIIFGVFVHSAIAQKQNPTGSSSGSTLEEISQVADKITVHQDSDDKAIDRRLTDILVASGWFTNINIKVEEGIVFLDGQTDSEDNRSWAGNLAKKVVDVVAVVNRIQVINHSPWDIAPATNELRNVWNKTMRSLPRFGLAVLFLFLVWLFAKLITRIIGTLLDIRLNRLLRDVALRIVNILIFLLGLYLALQIAGLSNLSATILGGTGVAGLIAGFAFRDLLENYLASILISIRNPFRLGDLVEINQHLGIVERVTTRGTILMNQDGNHVQIPNSIVYKSIIRNYTANPNRRETFVVGIGFDSSISHAQEIALKVISSHPAVLSEPEPLVLVDELGSATVNLKIYFWYDGASYNGLKVKSALIRLVKKLFESENISMPDEAREIVFPEGVPVNLAGSAEDQQLKKLEKKEKKKFPKASESETISTEAEGSLENEEQQLRNQARTSRIPEEGESLLHQ